MLFQVDLNPDVTGRMIRVMISERLSDPAIQEFSWGLFAGTMEHRAQLDEQIQRVAANWKLNRMAGTDRAVLRLGAYELLHTSTPVGVVIDEAVEQARKFGSGQSPQFVNGILDKLVPSERRKPRNPPKNAPPEENRDSPVAESPQSDDDSDE